MAADDNSHSGRDEYKRDSSNIRENMYNILDPSTTTNDQGNFHDAEGEENRKGLFDIIVKGKEIASKTFDEIRGNRANREKSDGLRILLVVYDNGSYMTWFPQGLGYVAAVLEQQGHHLDLYNQDIHHYPDEHLTHFLDSREKYDAICISVIGGYWQFKRLRNSMERRK